MESVLKTGPDQVISQGYQEILVEKRRKRRGKDLSKPGRTKEGRVEEDIHHMIRRDMTQSYRSKCGTREHGLMR